MAGDSAAPDAEGTPGAEDAPPSAPGAASSRATGRPVPGAAAVPETAPPAARLRRLTGSIGTWFRPSRTRH
ncbi:hypothetical protein ACWDVG_17555, partial [Streptomyces sp. NPDC003327]